MIEVISLSGHLSNIDETFDAGIEIYASKLITKKAEKSGSEFLCNFKCHIRHCEGGGADYAHYITTCHLRFSNLAPALQSAFSTVVCKEDLCTLLDFKMFTLKVITLN